MKYACIGEHLKHSFSKEIHNAFADYEYEIKEVARDELESFALKRDFLGINVTIPYKELIMPYLYKTEEAALKIGAVNTVVNRDGRLYGYNTDFYGMCELFCHAGIDPCGKKAAILGTGGTSKTAYAVLSYLGASTVLKVSRTRSIDAISYDELYSEHPDTEIIVNTTPVGMFPDTDKSPVSLSRFKKLSGVIDAVYNPLRTELISEAKRHGIKCEGGLYMLVAQAKAASEHFTGKSYTKAELEAVYKKILGQKENIVLIGMPSSGKSTVGKALSELLSRELFDSDTLIEEKAGMSISKIFELYGEEKFRALESKVIKELSSKTGVIISSGGGAILRDENVRALKKNGRLVFLDRELKDLTPTDSRPLARDTEALKKRFLERYPIYSALADITVKVNKTPTELAEDIKEKMDI